MSTTFLTQETTFGVCPACGEGVTYTPGKHLKAFVVTYNMDDGSTWKSYRHWPCRRAQLTPQAVQATLRKLEN